MVMFARSYARIDSCTSYDVVADQVKPEAEPAKATVLSIDSVEAAVQAV
jgi:hypothetical protein